MMTRRMMMPKTQMISNMDNLILLAKSYRKFLLELGEQFEYVKRTEDYKGFADSFIDAVKSPEVGFSVAEAESMIKMYHKFALLPIDELPSHHAMKIMATRKVDMDLLKSAQVLSVTDFKESIKDKELGTQDRTYTYEIIKRAKESGSIKKVYGDEIEIALKELNVTQ